MTDTRPTTQQHTVHAAAFVENFSLKQLAPSFPKAKRGVHELSQELETGGTMYIYPFGAVVFVDVSAASRDDEIAKLHQLRGGLTSTAVIKEDLGVVIDSTQEPDVADGVLTLDHMSPQRRSIIALTVAQSAAMEYYERIVETMFETTERLVERLESLGTVPFATRPLHRFIGAAIGTRNEVLSILHLLDKPDEAWDDPGIDRIYGELRAEFDLVDRYGALELKLRSVQEALELVLDVARDRRLVLLESSIVVLIIVEIVLTLVRY